MKYGVSTILLHLSLIKNVGAATIEKIVAALGLEALADLPMYNAQDLAYRTGLDLKRASYIIAQLKSEDTRKLLDEELSLAAKHAIIIITQNDDCYPQLLKHIHLPPPVLYLKGDISCLRRDKDYAKILAMVGSRSADSYGYSVVKSLVPELVNYDYTLVSGGALGIDTAVHQETLRSKGSTIAVLGSGLLKPYPASNKKLFDYLAHNKGAVISSFPLMTSPLAGNFPARNRIIAGLAQGCIVAQADKPSGALITAHYALQEGREVFAVPGDITNVLSRGCHYLLSQGATLVETAMDIMNAFESNLIVFHKESGAKSQEKTLSREKSQQEVLAIKKISKNT